MGVKREQEPVWSAPCHGSFGSNPNSCQVSHKLWVVVGRWAAVPCVQGLGQDEGSGSKQLGKT